MIVRVSRNSLGGCLDLGCRDMNHADRSIYTLGHSRHPIERFVALAEGAPIELIVDVRGQPFSRFNPQFNRERFRAALESAGVGYLWLGETLSGRPTDPRFRDADGGVDWGAVRVWPAFQADIGRVADKAGEARLALVCAEEDPRKCHRRFLLTPPLIEKGLTVLHVRGDGRIETEEEVGARDRLKRDRAQLDLFEANGER